MDFVMTGDRKELTDVLGAAAKVVATSVSNPVISQMHLIHSEEKGRTYVEATDNRMAVRIVMDAQFDQPEVDVLFSPKFAQAVKAQSDGQVRVEMVGTQATVTGTGRGKYTVTTSTGEWPNIKVGEEEVNWDDVPGAAADEVLGKIGRASRFASKNDAQHPATHGVHLRMEETGTLVTESTDSYRMYQHRTASGGPWPMKGEDAVVPFAMVQNLEALFPGSVEIKLASDDSLFYARDLPGTIHFSCRRVGGKFPEVDRLVPTDSKWNLTVNRAELETALSRVRAMTDGSTPVELTIEKDGLLSLMRLRSATKDGEEAVEYVSLPNDEYEPFRAAFNIKYLDEALDAFSDDEIQIELTGELKPALLQAGTTRMLVMAVRLA
jgi:DNA polymerase III subunit beta